jgi:hypothetical protein
MSEERPYGYEAYMQQMCPHCGWKYPLYQARNSKVPPHASIANEPYCPGTGQNPRNPESDMRPLWGDSIEACNHHLDSAGVPALGPLAAFTLQDRIVWLINAYQLQCRVTNNLREEIKFVTDKLNKEL